MGTNHLAIARKALAYAIFSDIVKGSIASLGSVNSSEPAKVAAVVHDEVVNAVKNKSN